MAIIGLFLASVAVGFALNRFIIARIATGRHRAVALALSRGVFYAPSFIHVGHGAYLPYPLIMALVSSFDEFGIELGLYVFLLPGIVALGSLVVSWWKANKVRGRTSDA